ncbi:MAG TPA: imidazole glycerol phosphate synthase subunit HisH [Bacillota bacterium]|nr:imidazole glycerol phosphate synthase subunit HisH [Bacillota bacterium]HOK69222.1 imidazole glycerol phosphate synthase subunit HisH [Bacillota bacterium]HPP84675.1 imidazole glycerol phosphate synthase subunit HisH [Bacillota bacterium]
MIAIVNYGVGNLFSISRSLSYIGLDNVITDDKKTIESASHIVLPGVGAFGDAVQKLEATGLIPTLDACVKKGTPLLGVCLGMQLLFEKSYEYGVHTGLGYLQGEVCPMEPDLKAKGYDIKVPHIGWNALKIKKDSALLKFIKDGDFMYFVHSYYAKNCEDSLIAAADYGIEVPAVVGAGNVFGCQFHPEKSGACGLKILKAFGEIK